MKSAALLTAISSAAVTSALSTSEWQAQSIYQVLTDRFARTDGSTTAPCDNLRAYCGGTYQGLIGQLDYIQGMGFTAVWISPIVKNIEGYTAYGDAFHGYWAEDIWSLNEHFGTADDLASLSDALHQRGMYLMLDVVTNHMGYDGCGDCVDYSGYVPFDDPAQYHDFCLINYDDDNSVVNCWQGDNSVSLPDLRTEDAAVRNVWNDWIAQVVANYSIDGLRVDSVKHVEKDFFPAFGDAAGVYMVGEVYDGDPAVLAGWQDYIPGVMNYAVFYWMSDFFRSNANRVTQLVNGINQLKASTNATVAYGSFLENHDQARFPSKTGDGGQIKSAVAFAMLNDGIPVVYQGQEQGFSGAEDPNNREALWLSGYDTGSEMYRFIAQVNALRSAVVAASGPGSGDNYLNYQAVPAQINNYALAMIKGDVVSAYSNMGTTGGAYTVTVSSGSLPYAAGTVLVEAIGCGETVTAPGGGTLSFVMTAEPKAFVPRDRLVGSGVCGY